MGDFQGGLVSRTSKYYNNPEFSDVEFTVKDGLSCTTIYAHKQILSMASSVFSSLFTEKTQQKIQIKINEFSPRIVDLVLSYLYTDELILKNIDEAVDVLKLSEKFGIHELKVLCRKYISIDNVSLENVLTVYEIAVKEHVPECLKKCHELVSHQTADVLALPRFREASVQVILDILKLNSLSVGEYDLLLGLMRWVKRDCEKRGRPTENVCLRDSLSPLLPYIRILTISIEDFYEFVEEYGIFTTPESIKLTRLILEPKAPCSIPAGFCNNKTPRFHKVNVNQHPALMQAPPHKVPAAFSRSRASPPITLNNLSSQNNNTMTAPVITSLQNGVWDDNLSGPEKPLFQFAATSLNSPPPTATQRRPPMLKVINNQMPNLSRKIYDFPLLEIHPEHLGLNAVSVNDLICSAELKCSKGSIAIIGVELKVANQKQNEELTKVYTLISGDVPEEEIVNHYKFINNMVQIIFPNPIKLNCTGPNVAKLEITIEDMKLNRCNVCRVHTCEINSGLNLTTQVKLKSNQPNQGDGFFFFISRLIYS